MFILHEPVTEELKSQPPHLMVHGIITRSNNLSDLFYGEFVETSDFSTKPRLLLFTVFSYLVYKKEVSVRVVHTTIPHYNLLCFTSTIPQRVNIVVYEGHDPRKVA